MTTEQANENIDPSEPCVHHDAIDRGTCRTSSICLPLVLESEDIDQLENIIQRSRPIQEGQRLYREGDTFNSVFALRSGSMKAYRAIGDGLEQITGFYFPGEILGVDGIGNNMHTSTAEALQSAAVCEIPFSSLKELSSMIPSLKQHFFQLMSREITADQQLITLLSKNSADARVATLILSIFGRSTRGAIGTTQIRLPMSLVDIGNYLGLSVETVNLVLSRMQKMKILRVDNLKIEVIDSEGLQNMAVSED